MVAASMPPNTVVPIDCRLAAPAPVANISGTTPRMKAKAVIRIGRSRRRAASIAASTMLETFLAPPLGELDDQDRVLGGEADQHDEADLRIDVDLHAAQPQRQQRAEQRERHREQDHERHRPALVLRRQDQEDEDDREARRRRWRSSPP